MVSNTVPPPFALPPPTRARCHMEEPDEFLLEAMREVDAMLPHTPPITPPAQAPTLTMRIRGLDLSTLRVPDARAAEVEPTAYPEPPPLPAPDVDLFKTYRRD